MPHLVAIDLPGGPDFVAALRREWDAGNAVLPVDRRLPAPARTALFAALEPTLLLDAQGRHRMPGRGVEHGDALVVATSGATGTPKGVVLTHAAVIASARATSDRLGITSDDTWLACLPLSHVGGLSVVTRAIHTDIRVVVHDGFDAEKVAAAGRNGATAVSLVTTALQRIDATLFRVIVVGGSRPPADLPDNVHATYGLTETGSGIVYDGAPLDGVELAIAPDGEILVRCPMLMRCYRDGSTPIDKDGWLHTGDLGHLLADGRLVVEGRAGDMIITGGENVWPEAVEGAIATHPSVADVAVAGTPDAEWGHRVVAWVVPRVATPKSGPPTLADLRAHVCDQLPSFCAPRELRIVERLPRTSLGKLQRHLLLVTDEPRP
ncbi:MAG: AMP-binding protein [Actinobacteria bacterium]|nr:AMP-binding protein [Actinomycetota bacterium]